MIKCLLVVFTIGAVGMDLFRQKIENGWICLGWLTGLVFQICQHQGNGVLSFILGSIVPIAFLYVLFLFRMMGAGDIKLLSVIGGLMGPVSILHCLFFSLLFGAIVSFVVLIMCDNLFTRLRYFTEYFKRLLETKEILPYMVRGKRMENVHFSVPIFMGVLLYVGGMY